MLHRPVVPGWKAVGWIILGLVFAVSSGVAEVDDPIRVGVIAPFSGPVAAFGNALRNGIELALKESARKSRVEILWEDDRFEPRLTVSAFNKLTGIDRADLIISLASTPSLAVAPLAESHRIPLLAWASDASVTKGRKYSIRTYPSGETEGLTIGERAAELGYSKIASFYVVSDYAQSVHRGLLQSKVKDEVVFDQEIPSGLLDFRALLLRAKSLEVKALFACLDVGQAAVLARQARELRMSLDFFGCENLNSFDELKAAEGALDNAWFVSAGVNEDFRRRYRAAFGNEDVLSGAAIHYDLIRLLKSLPAKHRSAEEFIEALMSSSLPFGGGVLHGEFKKTPTDQFLDLELVVKKMSDLSR